MSVRAVIFDLDGVLIDSLRGIHRSIEVAFERHGLAPPSDSEVRSVIGPPLAEGLRNLLRARGRPPSILDDVVASFREDYATTSLRLTTLHPGVHHMLERLRNLGWSTALATSKAARATVPLLGQFELKASLDVIGLPIEGSADDKTSVLRRVLDQLGVDGSAAAMVGDRSHDMVAAKHWGCLGVGATWGYGTADELLDAGAALLVDRPADIADSLGTFR